jgi:hypothetical protein
VERLLSQVAPDIKAKILGNAPWGVYKYKYPSKTVTSLPNLSIGAKVNQMSLFPYIVYSYILIFVHCVFFQVFFFKAQVISGEIITKTQEEDDKNKNTTTADYVWLTRDELNTKFLDENTSKSSTEYYKQLRVCLIDQVN